MKKTILKKFVLLFFGLLLAARITTVAVLAAPVEAGDVQNPNLSEFQSKYPLEKIVILSRHNLRAPLTVGKDSLLAKLTPHTWFPWTGKSGELSLRGGELETLMGQYFRKWLEQEGFIPENYVPGEGEVRFYANSAQRTIATAQYFSSGMLPIANVQVERHMALNEFDPVFQIFSLGALPRTGSFQEQFRREMEAMGGAESLGKSVSREVALVEKVLDFKDSVYARENKLQSFHKKGEADYSVTVDDVLHLSGSIRPAMTAADALVLQYYEEEDPLKAAFGHKLTDEDWRGIGRLQSLGGYTILHLPSVASHGTKPMLETLLDELSLPKRKFTFLCGHDTNVVTVLSALGVEDYELPHTIETKTPIGLKLVMEKRRGDDGKDYASLKMMYQSTEQIRRREMLSLENPPVIVRLRLKGLKANKDGLYLFDDLMGRFSEAIARG